MPVCVYSLFFFVFLSFSLSLCLFLALSLFISVCLCPSISVDFCMYLPVSISPSGCLSVSVLLYLSLSLYVTIRHTYQAYMREIERENRLTSHSPFNSCSNQVFRKQYLKLQDKQSMFLNKHTLYRKERNLKHGYINRYVFFSMNKMINA